MLLIPMRGAATSDLALNTAEQAASAEPRTARNAVFLEVGGSALFLSINYDRMLSEYFSLRAGIGGFSVEGDGALLSPILFNLLLGPPSHKLEIGAGISLVIRPDGPFAPTIPIAFGIRMLRSPRHSEKESCACASCRAANAPCSPSSTMTLLGAKDPRLTRSRQGAAQDDWICLQPRAERLRSDRLVELAQVQEHMQGDRQSGVASHVTSYVA
jgi:hypothetical protein